MFSQPIFISNNPPQPVFLFTPVQGGLLGCPLLLRSSLSAAFTFGSGPFVLRGRVRLKRRHLRLAQLDGCEAGCFLLHLTLLCVF